VASLDQRNAFARRISDADGAFAPLVQRAGPPPARKPAPVDARFPTLIRSITFQLLATQAANTIHARVVQACGGAVTVNSVLDTGAALLKDAGLSRAKSEAMIDLAAHVADGRVALDHHGRLSDAAIIREVTAVKGIGPWTVQMYLMHTLGRRDVWPVGDYGVRLGWSLLHQMNETISERDLRPAGEPFDGLRSDVAWYCWQAVHFLRDAK